MSERGGACRRARPHLAELSLGVLEGRARGAVLSHLDACSVCALEAERLAGTADLLAELARPASPPRHLERAVLTRGRDPRAARHRRLRRGVLVGVGALALLAAGLAAGRLTAPPEPARPPTAYVPAVGATPPAPTTRTLTSALRDPHGAVVGRVELQAGATPWLVVHLTAEPAPVVRCLVHTRDGRRLVVGTYATRPSTWSAALPVPASSVRDAELTTPGGALLARASLAW